jgi:alpha-2-macroglobulin
MRLMRALRFLALFAAAVAALSQSEDEPYFSLMSQRTFASQSKPSIFMSAWNVDALDFRVYRVKDPLEFFKLIEDPHQFGGRAPTPVRDLTPLERFHEWKRELRAGIRRNIRAQFTESVSAHFEAPPAKAPVKGTAAPNATHYAEAPLLNPQQLVLSFHQPVHSQSRWDRQTVPIPIAEKGVYLVEAVHHDLRAYTILIVSDIALITKTGKGRVVNLLLDRRTGEPIPGGTVWLEGRDKNYGSAETGADGFALSSFDGKQADDVRVVARGVGQNKDDYAVNTLAGYAFGVNREDLMGYVYTDRPVYRPGHTVHFKSILRLKSAAGYEIPAGKSVNVQIQDPDQKPVYQKTLAISPMGTIHDDLILPAAASLGYYSIEIKSGDSQANGQFEVQEYKKPEYEVRVTPAKPRVLQGESMQAVIDARYFFGEPVNGAKVEYDVYRDRYWFPLWYDPDDESVTSPADRSDDDSGEQISKETAVLDADGKLTVNIPSQVSDHHADYLYRIEARVTDQGNREITGKGWIVATYGSFALNVTAGRYFYAPGTKMTFTVESRDYDNKPVNAHVHLELVRWNYRGQKREPVGGATDVDTGSSGSATATLDAPSRGGSYQAHVTAQTPEGRTVEDYGYFYISGGGLTDFGPANNRNLQIVPDKKTYAAGDTAHLMIVAGKPNTPVYITVEGRDLRQYRIVRSQDSTVSYDLSIAAGDEPGITVNASFIRNGDFYGGEKYIKIPPVEHQLNVKLATDKPQYLPGQTADYSLEVTDNAGRPAPKAEFSLGVVDEAIYAIRKDSTEDIVKFFFDREWNRVATDTSLDYFFNGEAGKRRMRLAELRPASRLAQLKPERLVQPKIRKAFPDTAFWAADLTTDANGRAHAKVDFPDSLTTWRATTRGVTASTAVGSATLKTIVRKNLILRLVVPRFFVQGDEVVISALVHNYLTTDKTARISLDVKGLDVLDGAPKDILIPHRGEVKVDYRVRAQQVRSASVTGKALTDEESDAMELTLPVNIPGVPLSASRGGTLANGGDVSFDLTFPDKVQPGSRSLSIALSPSIAGSLFGALDYLTSFPYGCVEQTMSSFLPNIVVRQAIRDLKLKENVDEVALQEKIRAGLERLYAFQHEDGGWGWWETDESHPFMTAYVVAGLVQAKAAGTQVNDDAVTKGVVWLQKDFAADPKLNADLRAYMAYALAVASPNATQQISAVYDARAKLTPYGVALLGLALPQTDSRAATLAASLESTVQQDSEQASWSSTRDPLLDFSEDASAEATAFAVKFLSRQKPDSPLLPKSALWLMNHRNEGYWWDSTKQTAMVIYGLTDYLRATHELTGNITATVYVNGAPVMTRKLDQIALDESQLAQGANHIRITAQGEGRVYYSTRAQYSSADEKLQKTGTVALNLLRDYFKLAPSKQADHIVYDLNPLNGPVAVGDIVAVRLTVTGSEWKYLMVEDPIPAGTEFIERDSVYELRDKPPWWQYLFTRRELHDDRMALFQTYFPQGQHQYFYLLKVVNPGVFQVSPARVQPMYQPGVMATSESRRLEAK